MDSLLHMHKATEERGTFSDKVATWLREEFSRLGTVEERANVADRAAPDEPHKFIRVTVSPARSVIVRAVGGGSQQAARVAAMSAAFSFSRVSRTDWPVGNRLAIVSDPGALRMSHIRAIQEHAFLGDWDHQHAVERFIRGNGPEQFSRERYVM